MVQQQRRVLAVGAAGTYAGFVVGELARRGAAVRGLVRRPDAVERAHANGAHEVIIADLNDAAALDKAAEGMDGVFHIGPEFAPNEAELGINMLNAALRAGVRKFVLSSVQHSFINKMINHYGKLPLHQALIESGIDFTILQPTTFMQSIAEFQWAHVLATGVYSHPITRTARQSWVDFRDVAEVAALALTGDELAYAVFDLCAGGMITNEQLVVLISRALGRTIAVADPTFDVYIKNFAGIDPVLLDGYRRICDFYGRYGFPGGNNLALKTILKREPRSLEAYLGELARAA